MVRPDNAGNEHCSPHPQGFVHRAGQVSWRGSVGILVGMHDAKSAGRPWCRPVGNLAQRRGARHGPKGFRRRLIVAMRH